MACKSAHTSNQCRHSFQNSEELPQHRFQSKKIKHIIELHRVRGMRLSGSVGTNNFERSITQLDVEL
jgi:hypothetical protein